MKQWKALLSGIIATALMLGFCIPAYAAQQEQATLNYNNIKITMNGDPMTPTDANGAAVEPFIIDGTTYLPVRAVANALGLTVSWDGETKTVLLTDGTEETEAPTPAEPAKATEAHLEEATLNYNDIKITLNGEAMTPTDANGAAVEPFIIDGTTYLPVRAVANALGLTVSWDGETKTVLLSNTSETTEPEAPAESTEPAELEAPAEPTEGEKNALEAAATSLKYSAYSYTGLIDILEYKGYTTAEATYAADNCGANWNEQAAKAAESSLKYSAYSYTGLIDILEFKGFTTAEATYAADNCGANWNEQASKAAETSLKYSAYSYTGLIDILEFKGFTTAEATYAADNCGADWNEQAAKAAETSLKYNEYSREKLIELLEFKGFTHEQAVYGAEANGF